MRAFRPSGGPETGLRCGDCLLGPTGLLARWCSVHDTDTAVVSLPATNIVATWSRSQGPADIARHVIDRHLTHDKKRGFMMRWMTWRAISVMPYPHLAVRQPQLGLRRQRQSQKVHVLRGVQTRSAPLLHHARDHPVEPFQRVGSSENAQNITGWNFTRETRVVNCDEGHFGQFLPGPTSAERNAARCGSARREGH